LVMWIRLSWLLVGSTRCRFLCQWQETSSSNAWGE